MEEYAWLVPLVALVAVNVINAFLKNHTKLSLNTKKWLRVLVDLLSVLTNRDSPGTLKVPLTVSKKPRMTAADLLRKQRG